jgi:hypothetical protein
VYGTQAYLHSSSDATFERGSCFDRSGRLKALIGQTLRTKPIPQGLGIAADVGNSSSSLGRAIVHVADTRVRRGHP